MTKEITKVVEESENKGIQSGIDREFFILYCEEKEQLKKSMDSLIDLAENSEDERIRADINKYIINQIIGSAKQSAEIEARGVEIIVKSGILNDKDSDQTDQTDKS
jgi:hypothetical protein